MGISWQLRGVEEKLIKDLTGTTASLQNLGEKYRVSRQAISLFAIKKGINRPSREHAQKCSICQQLLRIAREPGSDFISSPTIYKKLGIGRVKVNYHMGLLRKKGLVSRTFGRLRSKNVELAYQMYFKKALPIFAIGRKVGIKNLYSLIKKHIDAGWKVPVPLRSSSRGTARTPHLKTQERRICRESP